MSEESSPLPSDEEELLRAYMAVFKNPAGERVLRHLEWVTRAKHTVTQEEQKGERIDPIRLYIDEGMRRVFWKIQSMLLASELLRKD